MPVPARAEREEKMATSFGKFENAVRYDGVDPREGKDGRYSTFTYPFEDSDLGPQAFMVRMFAPAVGPAHFHPVDQFQIFFPEDGATYQRSPIKHPVIHYTDAYSTYGPFAAGERWLEFFTLRAMHTDEIAFMPEDRDRLVKRGKRNLHRDLDATVVGDPPAPGEAVSRIVFEETDDHMSAVFVFGDAGAALPVASTEGTSGRYTCVLSGELIFEGETYGPRSVGWSPPQSEVPKLTAGADGVQLVMLTFPYPSTEALDLDRAT
jgi:hypothetical protein